MASFGVNTMAEHVIAKLPDYILTTEVTVLPTDETLVSIRRFVEGIGWAKLELYMTDEQYERFCDAVLEHSSRNTRTTR